MLTCLQATADHDKLLAKLSALGYQAISMLDLKTAKLCYTNKTRLQDTTIIAIDNYSLSTNWIHGCYN